MHCVPCTVPWQGVPWPGKRVALVVGNNKLEQADHQAPGGKMRQLNNAAQDALTMEEYLQEHGFAVECLTNATTEQFRDALWKFKARIDAAQASTQHASSAAGSAAAATQQPQQGCLAVFYFSGHGVVDPKGDHFLLPSDYHEKNIGQLSKEDVIARALEATNIKLETVVLEKVAGASSTIILLDACRQLAYGQPHQWGSSLCKEQQLFNIILGYACERGKTASEGAYKSHGPFTQLVTNVSQCGCHH
jgi:hypothetical protein